MKPNPKREAGSDSRGITHPVSEDGRRGFLSDVIVQLGYADQATVEQAVRAARSPGTTVGQVLVAMGALSEEQLAHAIAERHGLPYVDLDVYELDPRAANLLARGTARRYRAVGLAFVKERLLVAMADPADPLSIESLAELTGRELTVAVAPGHSIDELIERMPLPEQGEDQEPDDTPHLVGVPDPPDEPEPEPPDHLHPPAEPEALPPVTELAARPEPRVEGELRSLPERLAAVEAERDEWRQRAEEHDRELASLRTEVEARVSELAILRDKVSMAETEALRARAEAHARAAELNAARSRTMAAERSAEELRRAQRRMRGALRALIEPGNDE